MAYGKINSISNPPLDMIDNLFEVIKTPDKLTSLVNFDDESVYTTYNPTNSLLYKHKLNNLSIDSTPLTTITSKNNTAMCQDNEFIYIGCGGQAYITKYSKLDLTIVGESSMLAGSSTADITNMIVDDNYIYTVHTYGTVMKLNKHTLEKVTSIKFLTNDLDAIVQDGEFLYVGGENYHIRKLLKSDLSQVAQNTSTNAGSRYYDFIIEGDFLYSCEHYATTYKPIRKHNKHTLEQVVVSETVSDNINSIKIMNDRLYCNGDKKIYIRNKETLEEIDGINLLNNLKSLETKNFYYVFSNANIVKLTKKIFTVKKEVL